MRGEDPGGRIGLVGEGALRGVRQDARDAARRGREVAGPAFQAPQSGAQGLQIDFHIQHGYILS